MHSWTRFHACFLHGKSAFANSSDNFPECPGWERYGVTKRRDHSQTTSKNETKTAVRRRREETVLHIRLYSPALLCFSCNFFSCKSFIMAGIKDQTQPIKHLSMVFLLQLQKGQTAHFHPNTMNFIAPIMSY